MTVIERPQVAERRGGWVPRRLLAGRSLRVAAAQVAPILAYIAAQDGNGGVGGWAVLSASWTITGTATFLVGPPGGAPLGVLRMSPTAGRRLQHESAVLAALAATPGLEPVGRLIPRRRFEGVLAGLWYGLDDYLPGVDAPDAVLLSPELEPSVLESAITAVSTVHGATARPARVDEEALHRWVDLPARVLSDALRGPLTRLVGDRVDRLACRLREGLLGHEVHAGWVHGDFWLGNLRVDPTSGAVTGIIDWDCADKGELAAHDLLHLALYGSSLRRDVSLGQVVAETVTEGTWPPGCEAILRHARWAWDEHVSDADVALLYWLRYTAVMIAQQRDYVHHSILAWEWRNVVRVLRAL